MRLRWGLVAATAGTAAAVVAVAAAALFVLRPLPEELLAYDRVASLRLLDRQGNLLRERLSADDGRARPLSAGAVPAHVRDAFLAAEDRRFFRHAGVDPVAVARAAWLNVKRGRVVAGGSTITQQLARTLVPRPRTMQGKVQEALWAMRLDWHLSKDEVLAQYLNRIPFGNGTFGVEAASQRYFGRAAKELSVGQAAALAALPKGPGAHDPYRRPERLERRRRWVLERMEALNHLSSQERTAAVEAPLDLLPASRSFRAPHFVEHVTRQRDVPGLSRAAEVVTTIDADLQRLAEEAVRSEVERLRDRGVGQAAVLVLDNASGEVLAYVGSADFFDDEAGGQNDGVQMRRQPGSALKPFAYLEAFRQGYTPASVVPDVPTQFPSPTGVYAPENYDRRKHGPVRIREALANSYNIPAVRIAEALGPERLLAGLHAAGFESLGQGSEHYGLGLVLGNGEVSLWEAARAYAGLARGGSLPAVRTVREARDATGSILHVTRSQTRRFAPAAEVALITHVLSDNGARARAFGLDSALRLPFPVAAKTGTSKGYSDNWLIGYTRERTVAVWAGNFDGSPMRGVSGITGAGPIFRAVMLAAMAGVRPAPLWDGALLESAQICPLSGERAGRSCPSRMDEVFARGTAPALDCRMHAGLADLGGFGHVEDPRLAQRCRELTAGTGALTDLGSDYAEWARAEGLYPDPHLAAACRELTEGSMGGAPSGTHRETAKTAKTAPGRDGQVRFTFPGRNAEFVLFSDLPLEHQSIPVRIRAPGGLGALELHVNGEHHFTLHPPFTGRFPAKLGAHRLTVHRVGDPRPLDGLRIIVREESQRF